MEASDVGVNSPEFLQRKIERLKAALEEANALMDRHVVERDEARTQLDSLKRENADLRRELEAARVEAPSPEPESPAAAADPALEQELRDRIAALESERDALQESGGSGDRELLARVASLQNELDAAQRDAEQARADATSAQAEATSAQAAATSAQADVTSARADATSARADAEAARAAATPATPAMPATPGQAPLGQSDGDLPAPGPFVSAEVIRSALDNDNFVLFCQPVFSLQSERITQYELLLRLRDADGRIIRPLGFLEPADRYGLMSEIDRWVVTHALELLAADTTGDLRLEVNLAGQSLDDPELTALIEQHVAVTDLDPARLILEVSENVAVANLAACQRLAKQLRGLGCGFALDDFGSTFASFRHLRDIPVNYLKIDGDLVATVTESRTGQLTIKSLVELARGLGAETIAEYVSDDQTLEFLREQGVGYAQGYRIGRPRPIEEVLGDGAVPREPPKRVERPALGSGYDDDSEPESVTPTETI